VRPLLFNPPGFVDLPSKPTHTHTHTRKCTVANMCNAEDFALRWDRQRVLSAIAVPTSSPDSGRLGPRGTRGQKVVAINLSLVAVWPSLTGTTPQPRMLREVPPGTRSGTFGMCIGQSSPTPGRHPSPQDPFAASRELASLHTSKHFKGRPVAAFRCTAILRRPDPPGRRLRQEVCLMALDDVFGLGRIQTRTPTPDQ
jgi:hypothetical protein